MEVDEAKREVAKTERQILAILVELAKRTGLNITGVEMYGLDITEMRDVRKVLVPTFFRIEIEL